MGRAHRREHGTGRLLKPQPADICSLAQLLFQQMANGDAPPLAATRSSTAVASFIVIVFSIDHRPQVIVALMAPRAGRRAKLGYRRPLRLSDLLPLPIRALLFAWST